MFKKYVEYYTQFRVPYFKQILETHDHELMTMDLQTVHQKIQQQYNTNQYEDNYIWLSMVRNAVKNETAIFQY